MHLLLGTLLQPSWLLVFWVLPSWQAQLFLRLTSGLQRPFSLVLLSWQEPLSWLLVFWRELLFSLALPSLPRRL